MATAPADVVALALPGGPDFVDALQRVWASGDAAMPVDPRLPKAERERVFRSLQPTAVIEADGERRALQGGRAAAPGDALVMSTSGTTGEPKGVVLTHDAVRASAHASSGALDVDPSNDRWIACLPLAHVGGLSVVTRALITETPIEVHPTFDPEAVLDAAERGATLVSLVTRALIEVPNERFRRILIGGAAPPPDRPDNVIATYGMTETGSGVVYERVALDGVEMRTDHDDQIWLRCPMLLRTYRSGGADMDPKDAEGWFPTGDLGEIRPDGSLRVHGRQGDVIVTGGEKVWPARVEPLLASQPGVKEIALVGRPDPVWGHEVVALVVANESSSPPLIDELREAVKAELPAWYAPKRLVIVPALPRTSLGKIKRGALIELLPD